MTPTDKIIDAAVKIANGEVNPKFELNTKVGIETDAIIKIALALLIVGLILIAINTVAQRKMASDITYVKIVQ